MTEPNTVASYRSSGQLPHQAQAWMPHDIPGLPERSSVYVKCSEGNFQHFKS